MLKLFVYGIRFMGIFFFVILSLECILFLLYGLVFISESYIDVKEKELVALLFFFGDLW